MENYMLFKKYDELLRSSLHYTAKMILNKINMYLEEKGKEPISSRTTMHNHFKALEEAFDVTIISYNHPEDARKKCYQYEHREFSIYKQDITEKEFEIVQSAIQVLKRIKGLPQLTWVGDVALKLDDRIRKNEKEVLNIITLDTKEYYQGTENIEILFEAIQNKTVLQLEYQDFKKKKECFDFHPYQLREYNNRWFCIGLHEAENNKNYTIALDRILSLGNSSKAYQKDYRNWGDYFDDFIGVTNILNENVQTIKFAVSNHRTPYFTTKPIHPSQKELKKDSTDNWRIFTIQVKRNNELIAELLSYGKDLVVLAPKEIRTEMEEIIEKSIKNYLIETFS